MKRWLTLIKDDKKKDDTLSSIVLLKVNRRIHLLIHIDLLEDLILIEDPDNQFVMDLCC